MTEEYIQSELSNFHNPYYHNNDMMAFYNLEKIIKYYHKSGVSVAGIVSLLYLNGLDKIRYMALRKLVKQILH